LITGIKVNKKIMKLINNKDAIEIFNKNRLSLGEKFEAYQKNFSEDIINSSLKLSLQNDINRFKVKYSTILNIRERLLLFLLLQCIKYFKPKEKNQFFKNRIVNLLGVIIVKCDSEEVFKYGC